MTSEPPGIKSTQCLCKSCYMHTACALAWYVPRTRSFFVGKVNDGTWLVKVVSQCEVCLGPLHGELEEAIAMRHLMKSWPTPQPYTIVAPATTRGRMSDVVTDILILHVVCILGLVFAHGILMCLII